MAFWRDQHWLASDPTVELNRAKVAADRVRARGRATIDKLLPRENVAVREKTLWSLAYESAARAAELLLLDVDDLDWPTGARWCAAKARPPM